MNLIGKDIYLKILSSEDIGQNYLNWMNDPEITQYLESRWKSYNISDLQNFVGKINESNSEFIFGIFLKSDNIHIGNIKIGNINQIHRYGDIGLIIGERQCWGKGYATDSIILATKYAFEELNLNKIIAGMYVNNIGSYKAFIKAGYTEVGVFKNHVFFKGKYIDQYIVEKIRT